MKDEDDLKQSADYTTNTNYIFGDDINLFDNVAHFLIIVSLEELSKVGRHYRTHLCHHREMLYLMVKCN